MGHNESKTQLKTGDDGEGVGQAEAGGPDDGNSDDWNLGCRRHEGEGDKGGRHVDDGQARDKGRVIIGSADAHPTNYVVDEI